MHFTFWMNEKAKIGGTTLLWDSIKACSEMKHQIPQFWEEYKNGGLIYCTNHPNAEKECGRNLLNSWTGTFPISGFVLDEKFQRNASKFAIFYVYENPKLLFPFFIL